MMEDADENVAEGWYHRKSEMMESMLGKEHRMVMHAIIPYAAGGALDLYYYPNGIPGTAIATKELSDLPGQGSSNRAYQCYELVMFTKHPVDLDASHDKSTEFGKTHSMISRILNHIAGYSAEATLDPKETCEFPLDMEDVGGRCLIFDGYPSYNLKQPAEFGLLAVIEVFRSEMDFARKNGGAKLLTKLKNQGVYPYSDLDRPPVA